MGCRYAALLTLLACQEPATPVNVNRPKDDTHLELVAASSDGALWGLRVRPEKKELTGPVIVLRTRDLKIIARIPVDGVLRGESQLVGVTYFDLRFCGARFGMLVKEGETFRATIWDLATTTPHPVPLGDTTFTPQGWSETCEVIATNDDKTRPSIRLIGASADQSFVVPAEEGTVVADVTAEGLIVLQWHSRTTEHGLSTRLIGIDRKTARATTLATDPAAWTRRTSRSWVVVPKFGKAPSVFRIDSDGPMIGATPTGGDTGIALDAKREVVAVFDGQEAQWWSLSTGARVASRKVEAIWGPTHFTLSFAGDDMLCASTEYGDVIGIRRDGRAAYRHPFAIGSCGGHDPCAWGNEEEVMRTAASSNGARIAIGTDWPASDPVVRRLELDHARTFETAVIDAATGKLHPLPARGVPMGFVANDEQLVIDEEVWSISDGRLVGRLPR